MYRFYYQILSGFDIATAIPEEKLKPYCELKIGQGNEDKVKNHNGEDGLTGVKLQTRYPQWNHFDFQDIQLEK